MALPRIDGTDEALALLEQGQPLAAAEALGLTKDQAKKLSRLRAILAAAEPNLAAGAQEKLQDLGLKAVALAPLVQAADWPGLIEILQTIDPGAIKREELQHARTVLAAKRVRVAEVEGHLRPKVEHLRQLTQQRTEALERLKQLGVEVQEHFRLLEPFVSGYPDNVREFLLKHLAVDSKGRVCLARRLEYRWQEDLKAIGVIQHKGSTLLVTDPTTLVAELKERLRRRQPVWYDYNRVPRNEMGFAVAPWQPEYKLAKPLPEEVHERIRQTKERLKELAQEIKQTDAEITELRHRTPLSFLESVQAANQLSKHDLETHAWLQTAAMRWLYDQDHVATAELTVGTRRWDVVGYGQAGQITIIEAKASVQDYRRDEKWREYLTFAARFYFVIPAGFDYLLGKEIRDTGAGLLTVGEEARMVHECTLQLGAQDREETMWAVGRALAKRIVFGF